METAKHTPGPWRYHDGRIIAGYRPDQHEIVFAMSSENEIADARLIAAAPDLLEALKDFVRWEQEYGIPGIKDAATSFQEAVTHARAALKLAGEK